MQYIQSRWFPRRNSLIADLWRWFFIASQWKFGTVGICFKSIVKLNFLFETRIKRWWLIKALDKFWATLEMRVFTYRCFHLKSCMEHELYLSHNILIFCDMPVWFFSAISFESCKSKVLGRTCLFSKSTLQEDKW